MQPLYNNFLFKTCTIHLKMHLSLVSFMTEDNAPSAEEAGYNYKEMVRKDKRRWERADVDGNGVLSKEEFRSYLHPEDVPHMANITAIVS